MSYKGDRRRFTCFRARSAMNPRWKSQVGSGHNLSVGERRSPDYFSSRSPIDCEGVRRKTVKLTSPTAVVAVAVVRDNGNANKSRIKMEQIASSENKGDATRQTDGRANEKYLPKRILLYFRSGLFLCSFRLATCHPSLPPSLPPMHF